MKACDLITVQLSLSAGSDIRRVIHAATYLEYLMIHDPMQL